MFHLYSVNSSALLSDNFNTAKYKFKCKKNQLDARLIQISTFLSTAPSAILPNSLARSAASSKFIHQQELQTEEQVREFAQENQFYET